MLSADPPRTRNVAVMGSEISLFMVAMGLVGPLTFVPLFASKLSDSPLAVGAVTAAFQIGWLPQVFVAGYVDFDLNNLPDPGTNQYCRYRGLPVNCGPRGLKGAICREICRK